jgi:hypothetical protein
MSTCSNTALLINGTIEAMASPSFAISLKDFPHSGANLFKIDHIWGRLMSAHAVKSGHYKSEAPRPLKAQSDDSARHRLAVLRQALIFGPDNVLAVDSFEPANGEVTSSHVLKVLNEGVVDGSAA